MCSLFFFSSLSCLSLCRLTEVCHLFFFFINCLSFFLSSQLSRNLSIFILLTMKTLCIELYIVASGYIPSKGVLSTTQHALTTGWNWMVLRRMPRFVNIGQHPAFIKEQEWSLVTRFKEKNNPRPYQLDTLEAILKPVIHLSQLHLFSRKEMKNKNTTLYGRNSSKIK